MMFDALERFATVLAANFDADLAALCTAKGVTAPVGSVTLIKRMDANLHVAVNGALPALCVYGRAVSTQARFVGKRDSRCVISVDYLNRADEAGLVTMLQQVELAAEAILKTIDRVPGDSASGVWNAAPNAGEAVIELSDREDAPEGEYQRLLTVTVPVTDRDEGL